MRKFIIVLTAAISFNTAIAQNVGIGTTNPAYPLDILGRVRVRPFNGQTAGIWFDGTSTSLRSFIGTIDHNHVGIWGGGGAGWQFAMNVTNGNVGVGTSTPTAKLDVDGSVRIRSSSPKVGSVLTSMDANGNGAWADPIAFRAVGGLDGEPNYVPDEVWTKILFNQNPVYNLGQGYQGLASQFVVTEPGVYSFSSQVHWGTRMTRSSIRIRLNRNGNYSTLAEHYENVEWYDPDQLILYLRPSNVSVEAALEVGDIITVEAFTDLDWDGPAYVSPLPYMTYFYGHLISRF